MINVHGCKTIRINDANAILIAASKRRAILLGCDTNSTIFLRSESRDGYSSAIKMPAVKTQQEPYLFSSIVTHDRSHVGWAGRALRTMARECPVIFIAGKEFRIHEKT